MRGSRVFLLPLLLLAACTPASTKPISGAEGFAALMSKCTSAAYDCSVRGGTAAECDTICDAEAEERQRLCQ